MFNYEKLNEALDYFKMIFPGTHWEKEKYKWQAVKHFQEHWDENATDFSEMWMKATEKTGNLLASRYYFPRGMIRDFIEVAPEKVRAMFADLFDESKDLETRVRSFQSASDDLLETHKEKKGWKQHFQSTNAISTYLWLRFPDKYYISKSSEIMRLAKILEVKQKIRQEAVGKMLDCYKIFDELRPYFKADDELTQILKLSIDDTCYPDPELVTLLVDFSYYLGQEYKFMLADEGETQNVEYDPGITVEHWKQLLQNEDIFNPSSLKVVRRFLDYGKEAAISQIASKYGLTNNFYNKNTVDTGVRVRDELQLERPFEGSNKGSWRFLFTGRYGDGKDSGLFLWKLRDELKEALETIDLSHIPLYEDKETSKTQSLSYTKADFLDEVYLSEQNYDTLVALLNHKKNIILQGPPGVGKTFMAKRLAYSIIGEKREDNVKLIQFHQSYSYEDFIMGYKPDADGFYLEEGLFYKLCKQAEDNPTENFYLIIDEINRGNLSRIFGELMMLIEKDYRDTELYIAYSDEPFSVPGNLYLIGTMNTADRSLAMIDYALRRRFSFFTMTPAFDSKGFKAHQAKQNDPKFDQLITTVKELNRAISEDTSLGEGFCIGHSYFCENSVSSSDWLHHVVHYELLPMLAEYWFDNVDKYKEWEGRLTGVLDD